MTFWLSRLRAPLVIAVTAIILFYIPGVEAHPGGLDDSDCHHCWTDCQEEYGIPTGDYHCHASGDETVYTPVPTPLQDIEDSEYKIAIEYLVEHQIVSGYPDGTFRPQQSINRAEFIKILIEAVFETDLINSCLIDISTLFTDVNRDMWFSKYVCMAKMFQIVGGYPDGSFGPANNINLAEAAKIIANSFLLDIPALRTGQQWYEPFLAALQNANALPAGLMAPNHLLKRGEMAEIIYRLRSYLEQAGVSTGTETEDNEESTAIEALKQEVITLVNRERHQQRLTAMRYNALLEQAAQAHAEDMRDRNYFSHNSPEGKTADDRIRAAGYYEPFENCNCAGSAASGENIAKGQVTAEEVMETWMNSSEHRANILNSTYDEIGIGLTPVDPNDDGFTGYIWVQNFGNIDI